MRQKHYTNCGTMIHGYIGRPAGIIISAFAKPGPSDAYEELFIEYKKRFFLTHTYLYEIKNGNFYSSYERYSNREKYQQIRPNILSDFNNFRYYLSLYKIEDNFSFLSCAQVGNKIKITWNKCDENDFYSYILYWDNGYNVVPEEILTEVRDRNQTEFITDKVKTSTYNFSICFKDLAGNISVLNEDKIFSISIRDIPDKPDVEYEIVEDKLVLSDTNDIVVFSNYMPTFGFTEIPTYIKKFDLNTVLFPGHWVFYVHKYDKYGTLSEPIVLEMNLERIDDEIVEIEKIEEIPFLSIEQIATAKLRLFWSPTTPQNCVTEIYVSDDGENFSLYDNTNHAFRYDYPGIDSEGNYFKVRYKFMGTGYIVYSEYSNIVYEVADGIPPIGDENLILEIV